MDRTRGKLVGVVLAVAATGLLAACGGNDSTASKTPTLSKTTTSAQSSAAAPSSAAGDTGNPAPAPQAAPQTTVAPERPQPVPTGAVPPADTSKLTDKDKKFLDALKNQGITVSSPDIALSVANYVCQSTQSGAKQEDIVPFVNAMAGSDPSFDPAKMPVEKAGQIYIDAAKQTYCQ
ncbi:DUF732 domain-containing protein [Nocardia arthritidis]|uniref:DUF732 domain-containing protein n=1 Tax=Nocardia arthritidis TaxID=228602 RepID=A0A6G9Y4H2_9NOCA|nr:DUF732 domain-containing protein [Nocardia arthritidis]QIS08099.1 DUF732 domain-containing protein [Nocardia arthritidis]